MRVFLLERYWTGVTSQSFSAAAERLDEAAAEMTREGTAVRHLRSTLIPVDEVVLSLIETAGPEAATEAGLRAGVPFNRIVDVLSVAGDA